MLEDDIKILKEKANVPQSAFAKHYPDLHQRVVEYGNMLARTAWNEIKYLYMNQIKEVPVCKICGKAVKFRSVNRGYKDTCSRECDLALKSRTQKEHRKCSDINGTN